MEYGSKQGTHSQSSPANAFQDLGTPIAIGQFQQVTAVSVTTAVEVHQVVGNWASEAIMQSGGTARWLSARQEWAESAESVDVKVARSLDSKRLKKNKKKLELAAKTQGSQAPMQHEEIRGLDDIFTAPITGLFHEVGGTDIPIDDTPPSLSDSGLTEISMAVVPRRTVTALPSPTIPVLGTEISEVGPPPVKTHPQEKALTEVHIWSASARNAIRRNLSEFRLSHLKGYWLAFSELASIRVKALFHALETYRRQVAAASLPVIQFPASIRVQVSTHRLLPVTDDVVTGETLPTVMDAYPHAAQASEPPVAIRALQALPVSEKPAETRRMAHEDENLAADWFSMTEGQPPPSYLSRFLRSGSSADMRMPGERSQEAPQPMSPVTPAPGATAKRLTIGEQLKLDREFEENLSSSDYIARNTRIVSDSLTNLVDRYFQQSAQEEDGAYY